MSHPTRTKVHCFCKKCGGKLVDPRTRDNHRLKYKHANNYQEVGPSNAEPSYADEDYNYQQETGPSDVEPSTSYAIRNNDSLPVITDSLRTIIRKEFFLFNKKNAHTRIGKISDKKRENF